MQQGKDRSGTLRHFLKVAFQYWHGDQRTKAYILGFGFIASLVLNLVMALLINEWSKGFFDALQQHQFSAIIQSVEKLAILATGTGLAAIITVQFRMRLQVSWRIWMMSKLVDHWEQSALSREVLMTYLIDNPEARIAEDGRIAVELLVEMSGGIIYTILISSSFIIVLWTIGGYAMILGYPVYGYLVYSVLIYTSLTSLGMFFLCVPLVKNVEEKAAAEGDFRYFLTENIHNSSATPAEDDRRNNGPDAFFDQLLKRWIKVIRGQTKIISFATTNNLIAPIVPVVLCAPKYLSGDMSLGDVMQTAAAFLQVQTSLNWLADNAFSLANWSASARRVAALDATIRDYNHFTKAEDFKRRSDPEKISREACQ